MTIHTDDKPFSCVIYKSKFAHLSCIKRHMLTHTGEKFFQCAVCEFQILNKTNTGNK